MVPPAAGRTRDVLVIVLTVTTGALDAVTFLRLGHVFGSVITGNLVLLGVAAGQRDPALALNGGLALAGYALGVLAGAKLAGAELEGQPVWPSEVTRALGAEFVMLAVFSAIWCAEGGHPAMATRLALLVIGGMAMGVQSAAVRRLGPMSSTYLTSTLAGLVSGLAWRRSPPDWQRSSVVVVAIVAGAAIGASTAILWPDWVPVAILVPLIVVLWHGRRLRPAT
jgi:uncharacterized membrane protein YoaK (UPF0700 family)